MINVKQIVEKTLNDLWRKYKGETFCELPPLYPKEIKENAIVFIGINPSISEKDKQEILNKKGDVDHFYDLHGGHKTHPCFKKFIDISEKTGLDWTHLDILYIRETQQSSVGDLLKKPEGLDFINQQAILTKSIIDQLLKQDSKTIFVVNNTLARRLLGKNISADKKQNVWMGYDFEWNEDFGTHAINGNPFFFTSMLTGQRALDNGSFERLVWQINRVKKQMR
jgi:hypothetical protein